MDFRFWICHGFAERIWMLPDKRFAHAHPGQRIKSSHVDPLQKNLKSTVMTKQSSICTFGMQTCHIQQSFDIMKNFGMFGVSIGVRTALGISEKWQTDDIPYPAAPSRKAKDIPRMTRLSQIHCHPCDGARRGTSFVAGLIERVAKGETLPGKEATLGVSCSELRT